MKSASGRETSQISMIKVRGSGREREEVRGDGGSEKEWEGVGGSGREDKQEKLLKQKVVLDTHFIWNRMLYCALTG